MLKLSRTDAIDDYRRQAREHERERRIDAAWACLEAAHIIGQRSTVHHIASHAAMLGLAWRTRDTRECFGQVARMFAAALITWIWVPVGNSGRANVSAVVPSPVPEDLAELAGAPSSSWTEKCD
jgi:hypothetical protein